MLITISGKHIEVTEAIRNHVEEKVEKLPKFYDSISQIEVVIEGSEGVGQSVEIIVHADHNDLLVAKEAGTDTYTCIDVAAHKMERQLRKAKEKQRGHKAVPGAEREIPSSLPEEGAA
ncbi:MAG: ribosome-associated translation inhibitor RaiA [Flavobacteriaceae bacterium]|nr:MAG: ribosome-associated translation inhibitor RaiA [Flavobacteriaceae bacterium]